MLLAAAFIALFSIGLLVVFEIAVARTGIVTPLEPDEADKQLARLSVVIPARNEAEDIEEALRSVLCQRGVDLQVIIVNDNSTDETGDIVNRLAEEDSRITVVSNPPLTAGWLGKPNAMNHGVALATEELILFTDADILHAPTAFATGISILRRDGLDFLSFMPRIVCESFWENVVMPLSLFPFIAQCAKGIDKPNSEDAWAAGAFMLIKADVLEEIGGIESIKSAILDDTELARVVKRRGHSLNFHIAPELMSVRMFKGNRHAFWGPTKNAIALAFTNPLMSLPTIPVPLVVFWLPLLAAATGIWRGDALLFAVGIIHPLIGIYSLFRIRFVCDFQWCKAIFFPLLAIPMACVLARAFYEQHIQRTLRWRDRSIDLSATAR